jgi:hypothetical protein
VRPGRGPNLSNWRAVRRWEVDTGERLRRHHALWLHGWCIGLIVAGIMWGAAHLQMVLGSDSLAIRYLVTLGAGYLAFLLVLRLWAGALVGENNSVDGLDAGGDFSPPYGGGGGSGGGPLDTIPVPMKSGGGGDFGGGGASGDFGVDLDAGSAGESASVIGEVAKGAFEIGAGADEGAVVVIPVMVVFLVGTLVMLGAGSLLMLFFGWEVLLAVAVEVAFGYVAGRTAIRVAREGWLSSAVRLTWKPLLGALIAAVLLGAALDAFVPSAQSLPHAIRIWRQH